MEWSELIGQQLGQYELLSELGRGTYARVYQAFQPRLRRYVAVKVLRIDDQDQLGFVQRFEQIAQAIAQLNHPNIVSIYDFGEERGLVYIVMQSVTGGSFKSRLGKPMTIGEAVTPIVQLAHALHHAHQRGVLHLDLRPENILIDAENHAHLLLTDFSLSQLFLANHLARTGLPIGSPAYLAPEQIEGRRPSARTDIYALGALLFEALAGQPAFSGPTAAAVLSKHLHEPPPYIRGFNPAVPRELAHVLSRALAKRPEERHQSAEEFARALDPYRDARERHHRLSLKLDDLSFPDSEPPEGTAQSPRPAHSRPSEYQQPGTPAHGPDQARHAIESAPVPMPFLLEPRAAGRRRTGAAASASSANATSERTRPEEPEQASQQQEPDEFPVLLGRTPHIQPKIPLVQQIGAKVFQLARRLVGNSSAGQWFEQALQRSSAKLAAGITMLALVLLISFSVAFLAAAASPSSLPQAAEPKHTMPRSTPTAPATLSPTTPATPMPTVTPSGPRLDSGASAVFASMRVAPSVTTTCPGSTNDASLPAGSTFYITLCFNAHTIPSGGTATITITPKGSNTPAAQATARIGGSTTYYWFQFGPLTPGSYQIAVYWNGKLGLVSSLTLK